MPLEHGQNGGPGTDDDFSTEMAEAIRLSLEQEAKEKAANWESEDEDRNEPRAAEGSNAKELSDLEFALQLSLAEEQSRAEADAGTDTRDFPALSETTVQEWPDRNGKGKGRAG